MMPVSRKAPSGNISNIPIYVNEVKPYKLLLRYSHFFQEGKIVHDPSIDEIDGRGFDMYPKDKKYHIPFFLILIR